MNLKNLWTVTQNQIPVPNLELDTVQIPVLIRVPDLELDTVPVRVPVLDREPTRDPNLDNVEK